MVCVRCVAEMVLGVAAYRAYAAAAIRQLLGSDAAVLVLCGLGAAACCWGEGAKSFVLGGDVWVALAFPLLIAAVSANAGAVRRWLAAPPLHWLGVISFSIYLVHDALLQRAARLADRAGADWRGGVWFVVAATACVVPVAWATFVWVERPGRAFVRRLVFGTPANDLISARRRRIVTEQGENTMIGYAMLGTNDLPRATGFYDALLPVIGAKPLFPTGNG